MHNYQVDLTFTQDRKGTLSSPVLTQSVEVATPPEFPKGMPGIWSPEHLFVAAISSCLMTTFLAVSENSKLPFVSFNCEAIGKLDKVDGKFMMTEVTLKPTLVIEQAEQYDRAKLFGAYLGLPIGVGLFGNGFLQGIEGVLLIG